MSVLNTKYVLQECNMEAEFWDQEMISKIR